MNSNDIPLIKLQSHLAARFPALRTTSPGQWQMALKCCALLNLIPNSLALLDPTMHPLKQWEIDARVLLKLDPAWTMRVACLIKCFPEILTKLHSLEMEFCAEATSVDVKKRPDFRSYLIPNEIGVLGIRRHLTMTQHGLLVSTGTERSFFDLALIDPTQCEGLIVRDFDPEVKAYVDFNVLLLRISRSREDYVTLSTLIPDSTLTTSPGDHLTHETPWNEELYQEKIAIIRERMEKIRMPANIKAYYLTQLEASGRIYFHARMTRELSMETMTCCTWRENPEFDVKYHLDDRLFYQLQRYAKCGNIIATVGTINDLQFLDKINISILDTSNICDYSFLGFKTSSKPTVIVTKVRCPTEYHSFVHAPLTNPQFTELEGLLEALWKLGNNPKGSSQLIRPLPFEVPYYSIDLLMYLRKYKDNNLTEVNGE